MKNILVAVDFSGETAAVLAAGENLAREHHARIVLLSIGQHPVTAPDPVPAAQDFVLVDRSDIGHKLAQSGAKLAAGGLEVEPFERFGPPAACILEEAKRIHADYVVMGSHGHGALYEAIIGSTTGGVLKNAPCPVLVVPTVRARTAT